MNKELIEKIKKEIPKYYKGMLPDEYILSIMAYPEMDELLEEVLNIGSPDLSDERKMHNVIKVIDNHLLAAMEESLGKKNDRIDDDHLPKWH